MNKFINKLKFYLESIQHERALSLVLEIEGKAKINKDFSNKLNAFINSKGSTIELRELLSCFGDYWKGVNHQNKVDAIDTGVMHIEDGTLQSGIEFYNLLHNRPVQSSKR